MSQNAIEKDDIVSVVTLAGEFVGKLISNDEHGIVLYRPRMLIQQPNQQTQQMEMGFAQGICITGELSPETGTFFSGGLVTMVKTNKDVENAWIQFTTSIQIA